MTDFSFTFAKRRHGFRAAQAIAWVAGAWRAWCNRMAAWRLQQFDDRMLADIGLTRADVEGAFSVPLWEDPSVQLRKRVIERRQARRR